MHLTGKIRPVRDFLSLYRRILRTHRHLPVEMRSLGDDYVKAGSCSILFRGYRTQRVPWLP